MIEYWFMFPISVIIASIAMMAGIGGAILFSPFFIIVLKLDPITAITTGLAIEMFGFSSGVIGYLRKKRIDFHTVKKLIGFTVPATIIGVIISKYIEAIILKLILTILILILAHKFLVRKKEKKQLQQNIDGKMKALFAFGGLLIGLISSGLGEISEYILLKKLQFSPSRAAATSVFLVAMSAIIGVIGHAIIIIREASANISQVLAILLFAIPGVIIGAQIGVMLSQKIKKEHMEIFIGILFTLICILMIITIF